MVRSPGSADLAGLHDALGATQIANSILSKVQELIRGPLTSASIQARAGGGTAAPAPAPVPAASAPSVPRVGPSSAPSVGNTTHTVNINLGNGTSGTINTASADDSVRLAAMLKTLESSARSAGFA